jgi:excisionase family DNA binding protein
MGDRELLTVEETRHILGIGRSKAYEMIRRGELPALRMGRIVRIPRGALRRWIEEHTEGADSDCREAA